MKIPHILISFPFLKPLGERSPPPPPVAPPLLSTAFDTVDHQIVLKRLGARYGVTNKAHQWFSSYLEDRKYSVIIDDENQIEHALTGE